MLHGTASSSTPFDTSAIHIMPISEHILFLLHFNRTWRQHIICGLFSCILQKWFRLPDFSAFSRNSLEGTRPRVLFLLFSSSFKRKKDAPAPARPFFWISQIWRNDCQFCEHFEFGLSLEQRKSAQILSISKYTGASRKRVTKKKVPSRGNMLLGA